MEKEKRPSRKQQRNHASEKKFASTLEEKEDGLEFQD